MRWYKVLASVILILLSIGFAYMVGCLFVEEDSPLLRIMAGFGPMAVLGAAMFFLRDRL